MGSLLVQKGPYRDPRLGTALILPRDHDSHRQCPAAKNSLFVFPARPPLPKVKVQRPLIVIGPPRLSRSLARNLPLVRSKALIRPSPKSQTSTSWLNFANAGGLAWHGLTGDGSSEA